ncbi:MAG: beta-xylosidase [Gemmatimonadetes bacterium]|nr:beta-xylosidase [Gemmatimonadota bacterium]
MLTSIKIWNEPNNDSHWDLDLDPGWTLFSDLLRSGVQGIRRHSDLPVVLGGMSPIDARFLRVLDGLGALDAVDVLAVHGFPLDWNLWPVEEWPEQITRIRSEFGRPVWVTETGVSTFATGAKAAWGMRRLKEALAGEKVYWYTLLDLEPAAEATTRHKQAEGSGYWRHFHFGLLTHDGAPKPTLREYDASLGICQWFQFQDERSLELAVRWMERLGVREIRTGLSWAESHIPGAWEWFDTIMAALEPFDVCATLCFTPPSIGVRHHHTSPPRDMEVFEEFAARVAERYAAEPVPQLTR